MVRDGTVYVNDEPAEDIWAQGRTLRESGAVIYPYRVREGNVFVLGDNRMASMDSRAFGEVNLRQIRGRIFLRIGKGGAAFL
jgi:signal peptidase I